MPFTQKPARRPASRRRKMRERVTLLALLIVLLAAIATVFLVRALGAREADAPPSIPQGWQYELPTTPPFTIAMDAGHGGKDLGAVGCINEVDLTEKVVYFLNGWLKNDANYNPIYCRPDGEGVALAARVEAANAAKADLLVSIHANSETGGDTAAGFECYPAPPGRKYHEPSLRFAHLVVDAMKNAGAAMRGQTGVRYCYYVSGSGEEDEYAKQIVEESDDSVWDAESFAVVDKVECPALLIEQCFVTNADDVVAWGFEDGCARAARLYYEAICTYFGTQPIAQ